MLTTYKIAFRFLRTDFPTFAVLVAIIWIGGIFIDYLNTTQSALLVVYAMMAYYLHRALMFGESSLIKQPQNPVRRIAMVRFNLVFLLFTFLAVAIGFGTAFAVRGGIEPISGIDPFVGLAVILIGLANLVVLTVFGTALPATAAADKSGLSITLQRAQRTWLRLLLRLLIGPGLFWLIYLGAFVWFSINIYQMGAYHSPVTGFDLGQLVFGLVTTTLTTFATLLGIVALCRTYRNVAPDDVRAVMTATLA